MAQSSWKAEVKDGGLFNGSAYQRIGFAHPTAFLGTIVFQPVNEELQWERDSFDTRPSMVNMVRYARQRWSLFTDEERTRITEVLTGCVAAGVKGKSYRDANDLPAEVITSLLYFPDPLFNFLRILCRTDAEVAGIQGRLFPDYTASFLFLYWAGVRYECRGFIKDPINRLDKQFRRKKKERIGLDEFD